MECHTAPVLRGVHAIIPPRQLRIEPPSTGISWGYGSSRRAALRTIDHKQDDGVGAGPAVF